MKLYQARIVDIHAPLHASASTALKLKPALTQRAKWSYVTRNVISSDVAGVLVDSGRAPLPGDLIAAKVARISQHTKIQLRSGRRSALFAGDEIVVAYGNRYAPDQFEAVVPEDLGHCHLVAAGGIAANAISKSNKLKWPTQIHPDGYLVDAQGDVLNLHHYAKRAVSTKINCPVICVAGTSMNAGKTTVMAALSKGLSAAGLGVAAVKATGTGAGNDMWAYADAGASLTLDFTDVGYASTYKLSASRIEACLQDLLTLACSEAHIDVVLVEIADGLLHHETMALLDTPTYRQLNAKLLFAAGEAMGALAGVERLHAKALPVYAVSGLLTASKLASCEAAQATELPVLSKEDLEHPAIAQRLL